MATEANEMTESDVYGTLAARHGYEGSARYRRILEYLMTPGEAELAALLPAGYDDLSRKVGRGVESVKQDLERMYSRGVIFARSPDNLEEASFALAVVQLHDITMLL